MDTFKLTQDKKYLIHNHEDSFFGYESEIKMTRLLKAIKPVLRMFKGVNTSEIENVIRDLT